MQCFCVGCLQQERALHNCPIPCLKNTRTNYWCRRKFECTWSTCDSCRWKLRSVISGDWLLTSLTNSPVVTRRYKSCDRNFLQKIRCFAEVFLHISFFPSGVSFAKLLSKSMLVKQMHWTGVGEIFLLAEIDIPLMVKLTGHRTTCTQSINSFHSGAHKERHTHRN